MTILPTAKRAAILARVSTVVQAQSDRYGIPVQLDHGHAYAARNELEVGGVYIDEISGVSESREAFYKLLKEADAYDIVIVYDVSRIGRDEELSHRFIRLMWEAGLEIHSVHRNGIVERGFITSAEIMMAAETRRTIIRTTQNARIAMAEDGLHPGGLRPYGYASIKGRPIFHPEHAPILRRMFALSVSGMSFADIAMLFNRQGIPPFHPQRTVKTVEDGELTTTIVKTHWHAATISQIVRSPVYYQGHTMWGRYKIPVPPLVSEELWRKAQRRQGAPERLHWPLTGHLRCGYCGMRMSAAMRRDRPNGERYRCQCPRRFDRPRCSFSVAKRKAEGRVEDALRAVLSDPGAVADLLRPDAPNPQVAEKLAALDAESKEAFETWRRGIITPDELGQVRREIDARRSELNAQMVPDPYPVEFDVQEFADMTLTEILELLPIVATLTKETVTLGVE